jgi:hypothetical protein
VLFFGIVGPVLYGLIYSGFRLYFENPMRKTFSLWIWEMAVIAATAAILRRIT